MFLSMQTAIDSFVAALFTHVDWPAVDAVQRKPPSASSCSTDW